MSKTPKKLIEKVGISFWKIFEHWRSYVPSYFLLFQGIINSLPDKNLDDYKKGLEKLYLERPKKLSQEAYRYWSEILSGNYHFKRYACYAHELKGLTKADLIDFHNEYVAANGAQRRKLSLAVLPACPEGTPENDIGRLDFLK